MDEGLFSGRLRDALRLLISLTAEVGESEQRVESEYESLRRAADRSLQDATTTIESTFEKRTRDASQTCEAARQRIDAQHQAQRTQAERRAREERKEIGSRADANRHEAKRRMEEAKWLADTVYEAKQDQPQQKFAEIEGEIRDTRARLDEMADTAGALLRRCRQRVPEDRSTAAGAQPPIPNPRVHLVDAEAEAAACRDRILGLKTVRLFAGPWLVLLVVGLVAAATVVPGVLTDWTEPRLIVALALGTALLVLSLVSLLYVGTRKMALSAWQQMMAAISAARQAADRDLDDAEARRRRDEAELLARRDLDVKQADEKYGPVVTEVQQRRDHHLQRIDAQYPALVADLDVQRKAQLREIELEYENDSAAATTERDRALQQARQSFDSTICGADEQHATQWSSMELRWRDQVAASYRVIHRVIDESARLFPPWSDQAWTNWQPPIAFAPAVRIGELKVDLAQAAGRLPTDARLALEEPAEFAVPLALSFPDQCSLLMEFGADGRNRAMQTLQLAMLRLLTVLPPGKVRFTLLDPVGLGQNFAGFMHLADYQDALIGGKIWTESRHIEQRLADLTEHMENVIQKYLRNEYATIGDYNEHAGEIAEPFRFLVVGDFPVNFSDTAAQRLASIVNSGARCGVYTLIAMDTRQSLPRGIQVRDLRSGSITLAHRDGRFTWQDDDFRDLPLTLDEPPAEDFITRVMHEVGRGAGDSARVEVPFNVITPEEDGLWQADSALGIRVPLGRSGATKLQHLELGRGTAQHTLIAGKTGSGKSTLLHVLVTNLALWYSPQQVEFYLVDFKKGVEFKTYATHELPHARAVAIESDREFGLSVLQRLDAELKHRGNRFRELGVQDLAAFRRQDGTEPMPRTLLVIDEFQELFVDDDKIGQDAALLMDRLVRQGRAFGVHVLLGSQTLGGAYSLARSTLEQMAVRIALQCSEADSFLIFSDDNAAARLLARPGEAIYNDAAGTVEGNSPFQICWLPDDVRDDSLERATKLATRHAYVPPEPQIVFEGNVPADHDRNRALIELSHRADWPELTGAPAAWLGEAIAIKDPTAAVFRRQSGSNLVIVGQRDESALALIATSIISLALQCQPDRARFVLLDGTPSDAPHAGYLDTLVSLLPHDVRSIAYRDVPDALNALAAEATRRHDHDETDAPAEFLVVCGLQRYRNLRHVDDYSFSMDDDGSPPAPDKQLATLLRDGPTVGLHTLAWCDTASNLERTFDRQTLREFELRVLFQMSATDSSNLIDSPLASGLGLRRAYFASEELGTLEKFRPYALPDTGVIDRLVRPLARRDKRV